MKEEKAFCEACGSTLQMERIEKEQGFVIQAKCLKCKKTWDFTFGEDGILIQATVKEEK